jgi:hypothetical protein
MSDLTPRDNFSKHLIAELDRVKTELKVIESTFKQVITLHADYVGKDGKPATSKGGFAITVNKKIAAAMGKKRETFEVDDFLLLIALLSKLTRLIQESELKNMPRSEIKRSCYQAIAHYGTLSRQMAA